MCKNRKNTDLTTEFAGLFTGCAAGSGQGLLGAEKMLEKSTQMGCPFGVWKAKTTGGFLPQRSKDR